MADLDRWGPPARVIAFKGSAAIPGCFVRLRLTDPAETHDPETGARHPVPRRYLAVIVTVERDGAIVATAELPLADVLATLGVPLTATPPATPG